MKPTIVASVSRCLACSAFHETIISASSSMALITSLDVNRDNVAQLATCGRPAVKSKTKASTCWKTTAITPSTISGTDYQGLSYLLLTLNLIGFTFNTASV